MDIDSIIYKKLTGTASKEELLQLIDWIKKDNNNKLIFQEIENNWRGEQAKLQTLKQDLWSNLQEKIDAENRAFSNSQIMTTPKKKASFIDFYNPLSRVAAILLLLVTSCIIFFILNEEASQPLNVAELPEIITKYNPVGVKSTIILPDKSKVKLNADSKLIFPKAFIGNNRKVTLEGEAFFEVTENPDKPFLVITKALTTEVKGTSFNIKAYDEQVYVAVSSGLVTSYENNENGIYIQPGEMAIYQSNGPKTTLTKRQFKEDEIAWKDGKIVFEKASFEEVKNTLIRWYGIEIKQNRHIVFKEGFKGNYQNATLESVMESISFAGEFDYKIDYKNNELTIW